MADNLTIQTDPAAEQVGHLAMVPLADGVAGMPALRVTIGGALARVVLRRFRGEVTGTSTMIPAGWRWRRLDGSAWPADPDDIDSTKTVDVWCTDPAGTPGNEMATFAAFAAELTPP